LSKICQDFSSEVLGKQNPRIFVPLRIRPVRSITCSSVAAIAGKCRT
jgi:hypothetical protein